MNQLNRYLLFYFTLCSCVLNATTRVINNFDPDGVGGLFTQINSSSPGDICDFQLGAPYITTPNSGINFYTGGAGVFLTNHSGAPVTVAFGSPGGWFLNQSNLTFGGGGGNPINFQNVIFLMNGSNSVFNISTGVSFVYLNIIDNYQINILDDSTIGNLDFAANNTLNVLSGKTLTITSKLTAPQPIIFTGSGGLISLAGAVTLFPTGNATVNCNVNMASFASSPVIYNLAGSGVIIGGAQSITLSNSATSLFSGTFSSSGPALTITKTGTGTLQLGGSSSFNGGTVAIDVGSVALVGTGDIFSANNVTMSGTVTLDISGLTGASTQVKTLNGVTGNVISLGAKTLVVNGTGTYQGQINGTGGITKTGAGEFKLAGVNNYIGKTTVATGAGKLSLINQSLISSSTQVEVNATLDLTGLDHPPINQVTLNNLQGDQSAGVILYSPLDLLLNFTQTTTYAGQFSGAGTITISASPAFNFSGLINQNPTIDVIAGTFSLSGTASAPLITALSLASGANLDVTQVTTQATIRNLTGTGGGYTGSVLVGNKKLILENDALTTYAGTVTGSSTAILETSAAGTNDLALTGPVNGFGLIDLKGKVLSLYQGDLTMATVSVSATSTLDLSNAPANITLGTISNAGTISLGARGLIIAGTANSSFSGTISGNALSAGLTKNGSTTLTLNATINYTGATTISTGTLSITGNTNLSGCSQVQADATLDISTSGLGTVILPNLSGGSSGVLSMGNISVTATNSVDSTFNGQFSSAGSSVTLTKLGANKLSLGGSSSFNGGTVAIDVGSVALVGTGDIFSANNVTMSGTATLDISGLTGASTQVKTLNGVSTNVISLGAKTLEVNGTGIYNGQVNGTGGITKTGPGEFQLGGVNNYTGKTTIATGAGKLTLLNLGLITNSSAVEVNSTFDLTGLVAPPSNQVTLNNLQGSEMNGTILHGPFDLLLNFDQTTTYAGQFNGVGTITINAAPIFNFSGVIGQNPTVDVSSGTFSLSGTTSAPLITALSLASGANLDVTQVTTQATIRNLTGTGGGYTGSVLVGDKKFILENDALTTYAGTVTGSSSAILETSAAGTNDLALTGPVNGFGLIDLKGKVLSLYQGDLTMATVNISATSTLDLSNAPSNFAFGAVSGAGTISLGARELIIDGSSSSSFSGTIAGSSSTAGLTKNGSTTFTLNAIVSYTGPTNISGGTLSITGNTDISGCSQVQADATLDISTSGLATVIIPNLSGGVNGILNMGALSVTLTNTSDTNFSGQWSNSDPAVVLTKTGPNQLSLLGANLFTGTLFVQEGSVAIGGSGSLESCKEVNVGTSGVFDLSLAGTGATLNIISIAGTSGSQVNVGSNFLSLTGTSTFSGTLTGASGGLIVNIPAGTFQLETAAGYTGATMINSGTLALVNGGSIESSGSVVVNSVLDIQGATGTITVHNFSGNSIAMVNCAAVDLHLVTDTNQIYAGGFSGSNRIYKQGSAILEFTGTTPFAGTIEVAQGTLSLNANYSFADGLVQTNGLLSGNGSINNLTCYGTISSGNSPGTITIMGNLDVFGTVDIELAAIGVSDLLDVTGAVTIHPGAVINITTLPGFYPAGQVYTVIQSGGALSGTFIPQSSSSVDLFVTYDANHTYVTLINPGFVMPVPISQLTGYSKAVATALFCPNANTDPDIILVKANLVGLTSQEYIAALDKIAPSQISSFPIIELENNSRMLALLQNRIERFNRAFCGVTGDLPLTTFWVTPTTFWLSQESVNNSEPFKSFTSGVTVGLERKFWENFLVGLGAGYSYSGVKWTNGVGNGQMNEVYFGPYLGARLGKTHLNGSVMGSYDALQMNRYIQYGQIDRVAVSHLNGWNITSMVSAKHFVDLGPNDYLLPEASINTSQLFRQRSVETGANSLNMTYQSSFNATMRSFVNLAKGFRFCIQEGLAFDGRFSLGYLNTLMFTSNDVEAGFYQAGDLCNPNLNLEGDSPSLNQGVVGCVLEIQQYDALKLELISSFTFGGISNVAEIDLSFEYSF